MTLEKRLSNRASSASSNRGSNGNDNTTTVEEVALVFVSNETGVIIENGFIGMPNTTGYTVDNLPEEFQTKNSNEVHRDFSPLHVVHPRETNHNTENLKSPNSAVIEVEDGLEEADIQEPFQKYWTYFHHRGRLNSKLRRVKCFVRRLFWMVLICFGALDSFGDMKTLYWDIKQDTDAEHQKSNFVLLWLHTMQFLLKLTLANVISSKLASVTALFKELTVILMDYNGIYKAIPVMLFYSSILFSFLFTMAGSGPVPANNWNFAEVTETYFNDIYNAIFTWGRAGNGDFDLSRSTYNILVTLGYLGRYGTFLTNFVFADIFVLASLTMNWKVDQAIGRMGDMKYEHTLEPFGHREQARKLSDEILLRYRNLLNITKLQNKAFGTLFTLFHVKNTSLVVLLLWQIFVDFEIGEFMWILAVTLKIVPGYFYGVSVSKKVQGFREWVWEEKEKDVVLIDTAKLVVLLDQMTQTPIGIGSGRTYVSEKLVEEIICSGIVFFFVVLGAHYLQ